MAGFDCASGRFRPAPKSGAFVAFDDDEHHWVSMIIMPCLNLEVFHFSLRRRESNAMPEIIFAEYKDTAPQKVHGAKGHEDYRDHLRRECEAHHTVRDFCDFSKHGPVLRRQTVSVRDAKNIIRQEGVFRGLLATTQIKEIERLVVTHLDGREQRMDEVLAQVTNSWEVIFKIDGL
jgi:hypothetical protein